jgi:hypothetical protein
MEQSYLNTLFSIMSETISTTKEKVGSVYPKKRLSMKQSQIALKMAANEAYHSPVTTTAMACKQHSRSKALFRQTKCDPTD